MYFSGLGPPGSRSGRAGTEAAGKGGGPALGWLWPALSRSWPPPLVTGAQGWAEQATVLGLQPPSGAAGARTGKCWGFRPRHAGAACCLRGGDVELRRDPRAGPRGSGMLPPCPWTLQPRGRSRLSCVARADSRWRGPLVPPALSHKEPRLRRCPHLPSGNWAQAGGGGPQRGVGTSGVTDLFEGSGWGRVGCSWIVFLYSSAVLWNSLAELLQLILLFCGIWSKLKGDNSLPSIVMRLWKRGCSDLG